MKVTEESNYRVEVYPKTTVYGIYVDDAESVCSQILADVNRHVNARSHFPSDSEVK